MVCQPLDSLIPLRIKHRPGVIFKVAEAKDAENDLQSLFEQDALTQVMVPIPDLTVDNTVDLGQELHSESVRSTPLTLHSHIKYCGDVSKNMIPNQAVRALDLFDITNKLLKGEMERIARNLRSGNQPMPEQDMLDGQQRILQNQQKNIDRLVTIQTSIEDVATQTFAMQENPVPRLFVVFPMAQYGYLYFICECNQGCTTKGRAASGRIHLARHKGYYIDKFQEFVNIYGPYVQAVIHILKNGITAPGINIPSATHLTLAEGVSEIQDIHGLESNSIQSLLHDMVAVIRDQGTDIHNNGKNRTKRDAALELLESTDLRPLVQYLSDYSESEVTKEHEIDGMSVCRGNLRISYMFKQWLLLK